MLGSESETRTNTPPHPVASDAERLGGLLLDLERGVRDRVAVRVVGGVAELRRDQLLQLLREHVLEHLGLVVDAVPRHAERLGQVQLQQPVVAQHLERDPPAARRSASRPCRARA